MPNTLATENVTTLKWQKIFRVIQYKANLKTVLTPIHLIIRVYYVKINFSVTGNDKKYCSKKLNKMKYIQSKTFVTPEREIY